MAHTNGVPTQDITIRLTITKKLWIAGLALIAISCVAAGEAPRYEIGLQIWFGFTSAIAGIGGVVAVIAAMLGTLKPQIYD